MKPGLASAALVALALSVAAVLAAWLWGVWGDSTSLREARPGGGDALAGELRPAGSLLVNSPD